MIDRLASRRALVPGVLLALTLVSPAVAQSPLAPASSMAPVGSAGAGCATEPVSVAELPKLDTDPYFQAAFEGMQAAAAEIGGSVTKQAPSQATGDAQVPFINNVVSQGVGVIAIAGNDPNAVAPALKQAQAAGVKVISFDSDVAPDARSLFISQADLSILGDLMVQSMNDLLGGKGEFAILSSTPTATNQNAWIAAIKDHLANDSQYAGLKLDTIVYGQESEQVNQQQTRALVAAYPNLKGIIVPAGIGLPAAARALEEDGLIGQIKLTGLAPTSIMRKYIVDGSAQDIWWNVPDLGYLTYYAAQALAQCKITGAAGETFEAGHLGSYTVGADGLVLLGPATVVTTENIDSFPF